MVQRLDTQNDFQNFSAASVKHRLRMLFGNLHHWKTRSLTEQMPVKNPEVQKELSYMHSLKLVQSWKDLPFWETEKWKEIQEHLKDKKDYLPSPDKIFQALKESPLHSVKVIILGQDPYPTPGMAEGLAFSMSNPFHDFPRSLDNIFKELVKDLGVKYPLQGDLTPWARQGVLLLNSILTVEPNKPGSHADLGWQSLTREILCTVSVHNPKVVFVLWGRKAEETANGIAKSYVVRSSHPSPLAAHSGGYGLPAFFGSRPFSKINACLRQSGQKEIDWSL